MASKLTDEGLGFGFRRSLSTGFVSDMDPTVKEQLDNLVELFTKRVFRNAPPPAPPVNQAEAEEEALVKLAIKLAEAEQRTILAICGRAKANQNAFEAEFDAAGALDKKLLAEIKRVLANARASRAPRAQRGGGADVAALLARPLTPRKTDKTWAPNSVGDALSRAPAADVTLSEHIDADPELAALKYQFIEQVREPGTVSDSISQIVENHLPLADYVVAYAYYRKNIRDINALMNFALRSGEGFKTLVDYAIVSAAREVVDREQLKVANIDVDNDPIVAELTQVDKDTGTEKISLSKSAFEAGTKGVVNAFVFEGKYNAILSGFLARNRPGSDAARAELEQLRPAILQYIKQSPVEVTNANADILIPAFITQARGAFPVSAAPMTPDPVGSDKDFDIDTFEDVPSRAEVNESAVKCAAQLHYGMVLGDELDIFNVVNYFTHKYLVRGQMEIQDRRLRDDLQMYVFSGKFTDLKTGKIVDRTRGPERHMFYRQVFNQGAASTIDDMVLNEEFPRLWKVLMLESAKYIERIQVSPSAVSLVPKQNVLQAVEDLQYNLSTHCVGMATVISPLIHAELDFVIRRILMHDEVRRQVAPAGGTWLRVVETLYMAMKNSRPKATILFNKARLGHGIIRQIAEYDGATFQANNQKFLDFLSQVDAFITTQSILQEALTDDLKKTEEEPPAADSDAGSAAAGAPAKAAPGARRDDWDF
jgi:hypothetical protein